jgi:hypothetical protein
VKELLRKGVHSTQTLYMTETMQINRKIARDGERGAILFQALIDDSY